MDFINNMYTIKCKYVFKRPDGMWNKCKNIKNNMIEFFL